LVELKKTAILNLNRDEYLAFAGFAPNKNRLKTFDTFKNQLSDDCKNYWSKNQDAIQKGIIFNGKFEKFFLFFQKVILPLIHSRKKVSDLFQKKYAEEQKDFFYRKWNSIL